MIENKLIITNEHPETIGDINLISRAMKKLVTCYPGYIWRVGIHDDPNGGMMYIINENVNIEVFGNPDYGFRLKLTRVYGDPNLDCVMRAGGEILERARLVRSMRREDDEVLHIEGVKPGHQPLKLIHSGS